MDFAYRYAAELEPFRQEVRAWLAANVPADLPRVLDRKYLDATSWRRVKLIWDQLGEKGWLYPTYPAKYGGGGLSPDHALIIAEELDQADVPIDSRFYDLVPVDLPALLVWGTEEQKERFLRPRLKGKLAWQLFTEPEAGSDLASLRTRAVRDGDDWIINGQKIFVGGDVGYGDPMTKLPNEEQLRQLQFFCLAVTNPTAPRHHNLGYFIIPADTPGISAQTMDLLVGHGSRIVHLDNVRVPSWHLIGGETQGWQVAQTTLEMEHGGGGSIRRRDRTIEELVDFVQRTGKSTDRHARQTLAQAYIDSDVHRLFGLRNYWMYSSRQEMTYHGSQYSLWGKLAGLHIADAVREIAGPASLLSFREPKAPGAGRFEFHQRESLAAAHPGGSVEIQKLVMARRLGVSRTKERAAPTPSTVGATGPAPHREDAPSRS